MAENEIQDDIYDDSIDINLRSVDEIGRRLVLLTTIGRRSLLDYEFREGDQGSEAADERAATAFDLRSWTEAQGLLSIALPEEVDLLSRDSHEGDDDELLMASVGLDAAAIMCWACGLVSERWDETTDKVIAGVLENVPEPWEDVEEFIEKLQLRDLEEMAFERERAEIWLWRAEIEPDRRAAKGPERREIGETIAEALHEGIDIGLLPEKDVSDFIWKGKPVRGLTVAENEDLSLEAQTALSTFNWICGFGSSWADIPLDV